MPAGTPLGLTGVLREARRHAAGERGMPAGTLLGVTDVLRGAEWHAAVEQHAWRRVATNVARRGCHGEVRLGQRLTSPETRRTDTDSEPRE